MNKISQQELDKMKHLIGFGASDNVSQVNNKPIVEFCAKAADGNTYGIVREFNKFYIKVAPKKNTDVLAEDYQYIGGFSGRKENEYKSYALAAKQFDLKMMSINESCAAKDRMCIETPKIVDAEWQINETKEMRAEINRLKEITANVDNILSESNIIGGFALNDTLPEAPAKNPSKKTVNAPFVDKATAKGDKDFKVTSRDHKKVGKPFEKDGEADNKDMQSDKNKKGNSGSTKYVEKAKYVPDNAVANQNPKGAKAIKMNESAYYGDIKTPEDVSKWMHENIDMPGFEFEDGDYVGVEYDAESNKLYAGGVFNAGMAQEYEVEYDFDISPDENLQNLYDVIYQKKLENGDFDDINFEESKNRNRKSVKLTMEQAAAWAKYNHFIDEGCCSENNINFDYELPFPDTNESKDINEYYFYDDSLDNGYNATDDKLADEFSSRPENIPQIGRGRKRSKKDREAERIAKQQIKQENDIITHDDFDQWEKDKFRPEDLEPEEEPTYEFSLDDEDDEGGTEQPNETTINNVAESYVLSDFGKHPSYRKKPMTTPPNKEVSRCGRDWNDDSAKGEEPFGKKIGSSAPYDDVINMLTDAIMNKLDLKKKS